MAQGWRGILFNALALIVLVAQQFGYTGEVDPTLAASVPFLVVVINLIGGIINKRLSKKE